jgi:hypothetical protein
VRTNEESTLLRNRLSYAGVTATLALFIAIGGSAAAGAQALITGRDVVDHSLTGVDVANHSLTGADIRAGSLGSDSFSAAALANLRGAQGAVGASGAAGQGGPTGAQGATGAGIETTITSGADVTDYQDLTPLATATLPSAGDYVIFGAITVHNTGASDDNLNCGLFNDANAFGGGGGSVNAGATTQATIAGAISTTTPATVILKCQGGSVTTYDLSNVTMRIHNLG